MSAGTATTVAPPVAAASAASAQGQPVAVVDAARIAVAAARAVLLEAIVQGRGPDGVVTLKTQQGNVQIRSTTPLPAGATVALELTRTGEQVSARLLPTSALRPPASGAANSTPANAATPAGSAASTTPATPPPPAVRSGSVGGATLGAVALASDPAATPRTNSGGTTTTAAVPTTRDATSMATATPPSRGPVAGAPPTPALTPATAANATAPAPSATSTPPSLVTPGGATVARASTTPAQTRPITTAGMSVSTTTSITPATTSATAPSMTTGAADSPMIARAAAAAVYAQARLTPAPRPSSSPTASNVAPTSAATPEGAMPVGARPSISSSAAAGQPASSALPAAPRLQPGTTLEVRIAATAPSSGGAGTRPAHPLPATVVGAMPQGRLVVDTPVGRLAISVPPDLLGTPAGETLSLEWLPETARAPLSGDGGTQNASSTRSWPQARDAAATLLARSEPAARDAADQLVPKPGPRLAQQMMGFIGRGDGDVARWLGEAVMRQLEQLGITDLVARAEGGATREQDRQPANGDWRHVTMPLFDGTMLRPIEIRARRRNGGQAEGGRDQSRFVVDCVHDELGAVQIDGLMTAAQARKRLDVILRSHVELPEADRAALGALFADTCGAMGLGGEIAFQVLEHFPVVADNPLAHRAVIA